MDVGDPGVHSPVAEEAVRGYPKYSSPWSYDHPLTPAFGHGERRRPSLAVLLLIPPITQSHA
jgi:hypothetical protein